jgi:hypothetical protein
MTRKSVIVGWRRDLAEPGTLTIVATRRVLQSRWGPIYQQAWAKFNELSARHSLGVKFRNVTADRDSDDINVCFDYTTERFPERVYASNPVKHSGPAPFDPVGINGLTLNAHIGGTLQKSFIFVPMYPLESGNREVGDGVKLCIAVHEMIHAASGLNNSDHSPATNPDLFSGPPVYTPSLTSGGADPSADRIQLTSGQQTPRGFIPGLSVPPIFITTRTVGLIKEAWPNDR